MKVPAAIKLAGLALFSIATLMADGWPLVALAVILAIVVPLLGADAGKLLRMFRPALVFILIIAAFQWLFSGPSAAVLSVARISLLYLAGSIVTVTTTETEFITTIERLLSPISKLTGTNIGRDIATMMTLAIAFIPIIKDEYDTIRLAQEARGVRFAGLRGLVKGEIAVLIPLIYGLSARADRIAEAMEARCYGYKNK
ncbi:MAG TPA: energy-coupling factor transporter transmembrane component T [Methanocella sp.]|jgi:energy-coupling factor transporter transmembrane protein EcfT